jgi:tetratricopeptide (TPR) repeat protein
MGRIPKPFIGVAAIIFLAAVGNIVAHQDGIKTQLNRIIKPMIEKDISGAGKAIASLAGKEDKVWYQGDRLYYDLMLEGAKQESQGNYRAAIETYSKALKVQLYEESNYEPYLRLGRSYIQSSKYSEAISALNRYKEKATYDLNLGENREWTLSPEGQENLRKRIEICDQLLSLLLRQTTDDLQANKQIFDAYFAAPDRENAEKVLAVLPNRIDVKDAKNLNRVMEVFYNEHIKDLDKLVGTGDRYALRIAFKATQLMDGLYAESVDASIGFSIKVAPLIFLEEAVPFVRSQSEWLASLGVGSSIDWILGGILVGNIDFDQNRPDVIKKEILLRIAALETVNQENLLELRDSCLRILGERISN